MKKFILSFTALLLVILLASCAAAPNKGYIGDAVNGNNSEKENPAGKPVPGLTADDAIPDQVISDPNAIIENDFVSTEKEPVSTFSADVDTASYTLFRKMVNSGYPWDSLVATAGSAIRTEEMVNYFSYTCPDPKEGELFGVHATVAPTPWNGETNLLMLTLKAAPAEVTADNNLVFLIDVSG